MSNRDEKQPSVLIVDDDPDLSRWLSMILEQKGITTYAAVDAFTAIHYVRKKNPDLVILDLNLGLHEIQGTEVLWNIKRNPTLASTVVLVFTGCRDEAIKKLCMDDIGADGYLTKGEAHRLDLGALIKDWLRLIRLPSSKNDLVSGPLRINLATGVASVENKPVPLTPREYNTLVYLAKNSPNITPWETLAKKLWSVEPQGPYLFEAPELIEACLAHIKYKLGREVGRHLITVPGSGAVWTGKWYLAD